MANVTEMTGWADLPEMLTIDEVAEYLRYSRKTIRRMIDDGRLAGVMLGRSWRIPKQALAALLEQAGAPCEECRSSIRSAAAAGRARSPVSGGIAGRQEAAMVAVGEGLNRRE